VPNLVQIRPWRATGQIGVKYNEFFKFIPFFGNSPTGQTRREIFTLDGSNDVDSRKGVPFGGFNRFVDIAPHFPGQKFPQTPNFGGRGQAFSNQTGEILRVSYYRIYCIDFNQILQNDRDQQVVIVGGPNTRPANSRWRTAAILKTVKSPYLGNRLTDFDEIWQNDA